jgi:hypothetical protein
MCVLYSYAIHDQALRAYGPPVNDARRPQRSPRGWEPITLTGDSIWRQHTPVERGPVQAVIPARASCTDECSPLERRARGLGIE